MLCIHCNRLYFNAITIKFWWYEISLSILSILFNEHLNYGILITRFCVLISPFNNIQNYLQLRPIPGPNIDAAAADAATEAAADRWFKWSWELRATKIVKSYYFGPCVFCILHFIGFINLKNIVTCSCRCDCCPDWL